MNDLAVKNSINSRSTVIHVVTSLNFGGVERHMEVIAGALQHATMKHVFVAIGGGGAAAEKMLSMGVEIICLDRSSGIPSWAAFSALFRLFRRVRPMVVHTHGAEANFHALPAAWMAGVPVRVGEEIGIPRHSWKARLGFRLVYRFAQKVVGISEAVGRWLVDSAEVPHEKVVAIYVPVDLSDIRACEGVPTGAFRVGFVGRLEPVKNVLALFEAFVSLIEQGVNAELWIVGDGSERAELERRVIATGLAERVRLWGYQAAPSSLVRQCHVYVQPSLSEGFGIALVEAMACGVPVIATAVGGAPEIIENGSTGWLIDEPTPGSIANSLVKAHEMAPETLWHMGIQAKGAVEGRFEPLKYLQRIEALYLQQAALGGMAIR